MPELNLFVVHSVLLRSFCVFFLFSLDILLSFLAVILSTHLGRDNPPSCSMLVLHVCSNARSMLIPCSPPTDAGRPLRKYESSAPPAFSFSSYIRNGFNRLPRTRAFYLRPFLRGHRARKPSSWDPRKSLLSMRDNIRKRGNKLTRLTVSEINCHVMKFRRFNRL